MELLKTFILVLAAIVFIIILITLAWNLLGINPPEKELTIKGDRLETITAIRELIYRCNQDNAGKIKSVVCFLAKVEFNETITSDEIKENLSPLRIDKEKVMILNNITNNTIVIRYENKFVYVDIVEGGTIGS